MNPADVQAILAASDSPSPGLDGLQRLADWGTFMEKILACASSHNPDARALLTRNECLAIMHYITLISP